MKAALVYIRCSRHSNAETTDTFTKQTEACRTFCADHGLLVIGYSSDPSISEGGPTTGQGSGEEVP
jgi:hypothetical protein